jgi:hypothetical protein
MLQVLHCVKEPIRPTSLQQGRLVYLYRAFWEPKLHKQFLHFVAMIALQHNQPLFGRSATSAVGLQLCTEVAEVHTLGVDALDDRRRFAPFPSLKADLYKLLLHADSAADTEIFWKPTSGAYFRHYFVQLLLF